VGPEGNVLAVDLNPAVAALAREYAEDAGVIERVTLHTGDVHQVLAEATGDAGFDATWASDVVWPGNFDDPGALVRQMAAGLRPGGVVALFYSNYYQATFLPGHSRLERLLRTASELRWGLPLDGPHHNERHLTWLLDTGLEDVTVQVFPRVVFPLDQDPEGCAYLETAVWPELRESAAACGAAAGMSAEDLTKADRLLTPGGPHYVMDEPGFFVMHPTILATGHKPGN
jgi:SAM-dependent methyltransferase